MIEQPIPKWAIRAAEWVYTNLSYYEDAAAQVDNDDTEGRERLCREIAHKIAEYHDR